MGNSTSVPSDGPLSAEVCPNNPPEWVFDVVRFCGVEDSIKCLTLSKGWHEKLATSDAFWRAMCLKLAKERKLYVPDVQRCPNSAGWKSLFLEMWEIRDRWAVPPHVPPADEGAEEEGAEPGEGAGEGAEAQAEAEDLLKMETFRYSIDVCARFKPEDSVKSGGGRGVVLPLHQRLAVIKAQNGGTTVCTTKEAMRILSVETGRAAEAAAGPWAESSVAEKEANKENEGAEGGTVGGKEKDAMHHHHHAGEGYRVGVLSVEEEEGKAMCVAPGVGLREFSFNAVFGQQSTQEQVYDRAARKGVMECVNGFDATILVYGQTGSGKTYTMFGPPEASFTDPNPLLRARMGIVPRACEELLAAVQGRSRRGGVAVDARVAVSYVEVYGNQVSDLLRDGQVVGQSRVAGQRYVLDGQSEVPVSSLREVEELLAKGDEQKRRAATAMNERSSRAHSIFVLGLQQVDWSTGAARSSRLFLADLGGSEKISKSKADVGTKSAGTTSTWLEYYQARERLQEAAHINVGLFALKKCIDALNDRNAAVEEGRPAPYVPYQDSKLTMLLSCALGGSSKAAVVVTATTDPGHAEETIQTLRFGERCQNVQNESKGASAALAAMIRALDAKIDSARADVKKHERWEERKMIRKDVDGDEVVVTSVLCGAEVFQERLEALLERRRELLGEDKDDDGGDEAAGPAAAAAAGPAPAAA